MSVTDYFSYAGIARLLTEINKTSDFIPLCQFREKRGVVLRHDVDLDIQPAYDLCSLESDLGLSGSYFFLINADTYNCQSIRNRKLLRSMADRGFEIGLHFDPSVYEEVAEAALCQYANEEAKILEDVIGARVTSVSLHNPSVKNHFPILPGWINAYDPAVFTETIYLSDSRMIFRHDPLSFFSQASDVNRQLLLHPEHYSASGEAYPHAMLTYLRRTMHRVHDIFSENSRYKELVDSGLLQALQMDCENWESRV